MKDEKKMIMEAYTKVISENVQSDIDVDDQLDNLDSKLFHLVKEVVEEYAALTDVEDVMYRTGNVVRDAVEDHFYN